MKVLNKKTDKIPKEAIYVGRPSKWGNPFNIGNDGTRDDVIRKFRYYAVNRLERESSWLDKLKGKNLVCWCSPLPCHADILLKLANTVKEK